MPTPHAAAAAAAESATSLSLIYTTLSSLRRYFHYHYALSVRAATPANIGYVPHIAESRRALNIVFTLRHAITLRFTLRYYVIDDYDIRH